MKSIRLYTMILVVALTSFSGAWGMNNGGDGAGNNNGGGNNNNPNIINNDDNNNQKNSFLNNNDEKTAGYWQSLCNYVNNPDKLVGTGLSLGLNLVVQYGPSFVDKYIIKKFIVPEYSLEDAQNELKAIETGSKITDLEVAELAMTVHLVKLAQSLYGSYFSYGKNTIMEHIQGSTTEKGISLKGLVNFPNATEYVQFLTCLHKHISYKEFKSKPEVNEEFGDCILPNTISILLDAHPQGKEAREVLKKLTTKTVTGIPQKETPKNSDAQA